jgi:hypothetical protein
LQTSPGAGYLGRFLLFAALTVFLWWKATESKREAKWRVPEAKVREDKAPAWVEEWHRNNPVPTPTPTPTPTTEAVDQG